jgi:hypothetical protein
VKRGKYFPVLVEAVEPPLGFRHYQSVDATDLMKGEGLERLKDALRVHLAKATIRPARSVNAVER